MSERKIVIEHPLAKGATVEAGELWEFPEGLIGLPDYRSFALLPLPGVEPFRLLCSAEDPSFGLVVVDPCVFVPGYELALSPQELAPLPADDGENMEVVVPVVLPTDSNPLSLNLKGPLVLWTAGSRGIQRISSDESHLVRYEPEPGRRSSHRATCSS
jgi:flagellar assembly factor FliW